VRADKSKTGIVPVAGGGEDNALKAVLTWIPIEVIGFYQAVMAAIPTENGSVRLVVTGIAIPVCAAWIAFATKPANKDFAWRQIILAALAFIFWAAAVQSEVLNGALGWWQSWMGTVVLIFGSVLLPIFDGLLMKVGLTQMK
jgi:hypothetical protein